MCTMQVHERSLQSDFLLALLRDLVVKRRADWQEYWAKHGGAAGAGGDGGKRPAPPPPPLKVFVMRL